METRDLNPEAEKPEVAATPATPAEALESQSVAAEAATDETLAQAAAEDRAEMNLEAVETQLDEKNLEAEKAVEAVEDEPQPVSAAVPMHITAIRVQSIFFVFIILLSFLMCSFLVIV